MAYYTAGTPATKKTLARAENIAAELVTIVAAFDKIPEQLSLEQGRQVYAVDTGVADAYVIALPATLAAYTDGLKITMKAINANTGASTVNVDSLGVKTITRFNGDSLEAGDIPAGAIIDLHYDGTAGAFQVGMGALTVASTVAIADGGTGAITAAAARTNLGVAIGSNVQAYDANLTTWAGKTVPAGSIIVSTTDQNTISNKYFRDNSCFFTDGGDETKRMQFQCSGVTAGQNRVLTVQDANGTILITGGTDVAVADGGTGASTAAAAIANLGALPSTPNFVSSEQAVTLDTLLDVAHILGARPVLYTVSMRCKTADANFAAGDEVIIASQLVSMASDHGLNVSADATNITVVTGPDLRILDQTSKNHVSVTEANWRWVMRAWL